MSGSDDDPPVEDLTTLAERFFDLWREQIALLSDDPATAQAMADMARFWRPMTGTMGGGAAGGGTAGGMGQWPGFGGGEGFGGAPGPQGPGLQDLGLQDMARWTDPAHMADTMTMMRTMLAGMAGPSAEREAPDAGARAEPRNGGADAGASGASDHGSNAEPARGTNTAGPSGGADAGAGTTDRAAPASAASDERDRRLDEFARRFDRLEERLDTLASELARGSGEPAQGDPSPRRAPAKRSGGKSPAKSPAKPSAKSPPKPPGRGKRG